MSTKGQQQLGIVILLCLSTNLWQHTHTHTHWHTHPSLSFNPPLEQANKFFGSDKCFCCCRGDSQSFVAATAVCHTWWLPRPFTPAPSFLPYALPRLLLCYFPPSSTIRLFRLVFFLVDCIHISFGLSATPPTPTNVKCGMPMWQSGKCAECAKKTRDFHVIFIASALRTSCWPALPLFLLPSPLLPPRPLLCVFLKVLYHILSFFWQLIKHKATKQKTPKICTDNI